MLICCYYDGVGVIAMKTHYNVYFNFITVQASRFADTARSVVVVRQTFSSADVTRSPLDG